MCGGVSGASAAVRGHHRPEQSNVQLRGHSDETGGGVVARDVHRRYNTAFHHSRVEERQARF